MKPASKSFGGAYRNMGAARVSLFFALWTGALLVVQEMRVEAAPVLHSGADTTISWWMAPPAPPTLESTQFWQGISAHSEVMSGAWVGEAPDTAQEPSIVDAPIQRSEPTIADVPIATPTQVLAAQVKVAAEREPVRIERNPRVDLLEQAKATARSAIAAGDDEAAYEVLSVAARRAEPDREHYDLLAAVMVRTARYEEAVDVYAALLSSDAGNPRLWAGYALALERIGRLEPSQLAYKNLLRTAAIGSALRSLAQSRLQQIG